MLKKETYITSLPPAQVKEFDLDENTDWLGELLSELNEELSASEIEELGEDTFLTFTGKALRRTTGKLEDHVKIEGKIDCVFATRCVQSGSPMIDSLSIDIKMVAVDHEVISRYGYEEETAIFVDEDEYELYPSKDNRFNLQEAIHEFIWLNKEPYPTLEKQD